MFSSNSLANDSIVGILRASTNIETTRSNSIQRGANKRRALARATSSPADSLDTRKSASSSSSLKITAVCSVALAATLLRAPLDAQAFGSKTSQSLRDDAKEYKVELIGGSLSGTIKVSSKLNRSSQETVTFDFSDVQGLAPSTKHGINIHDETGKSWNPELRNHGGPNSLKKFGASACHYVGDGCVLNRHYGDLGNIVVDGEGKIGNVKDMYVSLNKNKDNFIGGKEFVIHEREDDFATEANDGNAGSVLAKGSIDAIN